MLYKWRLPRGSIPGGIFGKGILAEISSIISKGDFLIGSSAPLPNSPLLLETPEVSAVLSKPKPCKKSSPSGGK
jgi:hypothetical protein